MQKIKYGLVVSDFDGTLVKEDGTIGADTKKIISEYINAGGKFALSTGRLPMGILARAQELGLQGAVSCCNGAAIVDIQSKEVLFKGTIPNALAVTVCEKMEEMGLHIHVYDLWEYYCNKDDEALKIYEKLTGTKANLVTDEPLSAFLKRKGFGVFKLLAMVEKEDNAAIRAELEKENYAGCCVTKSSEFLVEVLNENYSKGTAVACLSDYYGVPIEKTIGVGDQRNDIPMIEAAGLGIVVKNADESLKEAAAFTLEYTNEEGAVGKLIEKFAYGTEE